MINEAMILGRLYKDRLRLYRYRLFKTDYGESKSEKELIYDDVPCGLSLSKKSEPVRTDIAYESSEDYVIFAAPTIDIRNKDFIEVRTSSGDIITGRAGKSFKYPSHIEASLKLEEVV
jgi:hypothetical protein|nr:MAG TPA: hypothetical protein [Caudoviricetes sp.]